MHTKVFQFLIVTALWMSSVSFVYAADFNITPAGGTIEAGREVIVNLKIDSAGESINAAQAKIRFSPAILEIKEISRDGSIFNFWLNEPVFSNEEGSLEFIGGTPNGVSGTSLQVIRITFLTKGEGAGTIDFVDATIASADETGSSVLEEAKGASFKVIVPGPAAIPLPEVAVAVPPPVQITRTSAPAISLPVEPEVSVSLYPQPDRWYSFKAPFNVQLNITPDISGVSTALNRNPNFEAPRVSEGLFDSKTFPAIEDDGVYYLHFRFQNNRGWGSTSHYRIAVDTQPPLPFSVDVITGKLSDNPSPQLSFRTGDALSGIERYVITFNNEGQILTENAEYTTPPHPPGKYQIRVKAIDNAGNGIEGQAQIEILPIDPPVVTFVTDKVVRDTEDSILTVRGTSLPDASVVILIEDKNDLLVVQNEVKANSVGQWLFQFDRVLQSGDYFLTAQTKDSRGALSLPTDSRKVTVKNKPLIALFGFDVMTLDLLVLSVVLGAAIAGYFWRTIIFHRVKTQMGAVVVSRDLKNSLGLVKNEIAKFSTTMGKKISEEEKHAEYGIFLDKMKEDLDKIEKYIARDIEEME
ncbi:MAG: hypothetical protein WD898_00095 [Candidatus Paceibacterota bacterium]